MNASCPRKPGRPPAGPRAVVASLVGAVLLAVASGCGGEAIASGWTVEEDTLANGARRVINLPPPDGIEPRWVVEEELRIGSLEDVGPATFGQVKAIAPTDDGRIAVLDALAQEIRIFGPDGEHLRTFGGSWTDTIRLSTVEINRNEDPPGAYRWQAGSGGGMVGVPFWPGGARALETERFFWSKGGGTNDYRIVRTTFRYDTTLVFESRRAPVPVTAAERDSAISRIREITGGQQLDWSRIPEEKPVVRNIFLDGSGRPWVRVTAPGDTLTTFDVFSRDGRYEGTAATRLPIADYWEPVVRGDRFYTLVTDELDVPYVVRARIRKKTDVDGAG